MKKYEKVLGEEIDEVEINVLISSLEEFFKNKFEISELGSWLDIRKGKDLIAHFSIPDEEIYIIDKKYTNEIFDFKKDYKKEVGVNFKLG